MYLFVYLYIFINYILLFFQVNTTWFILEVLNA